jgi:aspartate/methionine/tyrosine aminotransferase
MLEAPLAPYLLWSKLRPPAAIDLAGSNLLHCTMNDLTGAREAVELSASNDDGYLPVVEAIAARYGVPAERVVTAPGCSGANFVALAATVRAGDDVLIERPTYDALIGAARLMGANVIRFDRRFENRYALDLNAVRDRVTARTRLIIVTSPHNPSGTSLDERALVELGAIASRSGAVVLVDEVYRDASVFIRRDGNPRSAAHLDGPFIVTSSLTKSYGLAGLRCGWAIAAPAIAERIRRTRDLVDSSGSAPSDRLSAIALAQLDRLRERARALLETNVDHLSRFLSAHRELEVAGPPAASICFPRLRSMADADAFVQRLFDDHGVAVVPGKYFESPAHFRISLAGPSAALAAGLEKIGLALALHASMR